MVRTALFPHAAVSLSALLLLLLLVGCEPVGPQRAEVSGTVKLDGEPVSDGSINFFPADGTKGPEAGAVITDGKFHIDRSKGPVVGRHRVELQAFRFTGKKIQDPTGLPGVMTEERRNVMPPHVNSDSKLTQEVKPRGNTFEFDIQTKE